MARRFIIGVPTYVPTRRVFYMFQKYSHMLLNDAMQQNRAIVEAKAKIWHDRYYKWVKWIPPTFYSYSAYTRPACILYYVRRTASKGMCMWV